MADEDTLKRDRELIDELGGPARVAEALSVSIQVVSNWKSRGIPAAVKVRYPDLFLPELKAAQAK